MLMEFRHSENMRFMVDHTDIVSMEEDQMGRCWVWISGGAIEVDTGEVDREGVMVYGTYEEHVARWREAKSTEAAENIAKLVRDLSVIADLLEQKGMAA